MFKSKTLFILGAGASNEVRMPLGHQLLERAGKLLDIRYENGSRQISGSDNISEALRIHVQNLSNGHDRDINPYLHSAWAVREASVLRAKSIDDVLFRLGDDEKTSLCGKLAIAECILVSEKTSSLFSGRPDDERYRRLNSEALEGTWFTGFLNMLCHEIPRNRIETIFENVSFISFNYDRCLKHFLRYGLAATYNLPLGASEELVTKLQILYPYGDIGYLNFEHPTGLSFGAKVNSKKLLNLASRLRTYTEQNQDKKLTEEISSEVASARKIVFLGFGYHAQNIEILKYIGVDRPKYIYGTVLGFSNADIDAVQRQINSAIKCRPPHDGHHFFLENMKCGQLFAHFSRALPS